MEAQLQSGKQVTSVLKKRLCSLFGEFKPLPKRSQVYLPLQKFTMRELLTCARVGRDLLSKSAHQMKMTVLQT